MRRAALAVILLVAATALVGCKREKPTPPAPPPPRVTVVRPATYDVRDYWTYNGHLEQTKAVDVRSKVRGYLNGVKFTEGTEVTEGDLLYTIDKLEFNTAVSKADAEEKRAAAEEIKAAAEIKNWKAQIVQARADLERISKSVASGAESQTEHDKAQATLDVRIASHDAAIAAKDAAKANREAAAAALHSAKIQLGYTDIKAKISGRISRTHADEGTLVQADTTLLTTILKVDQLYVYFDAPEADLIAFRHSDPWSEHIPVEVGVTKEEGFPHVGKIDFRENRVETSTGTIRIRGIIDNPLLTKNVRQLFPGMYARVRVPKSEPKPQLVLPEDCLLSGQEGRFVYVVRPDGNVKRRGVTVGATVWKAPAPTAAPPAPGWLAVKKPGDPATSQNPAASQKTILHLRSMVAVAFHPLEGDNTPGNEEIVILEGLQQARPGSAVTPEEWNLRPPEPKK
jgi:membrane fusion protein, multidrug efflux system